MVGGGGQSLMPFWNSEKLWNFKAHELSWIFNESCTRILRVPSSCPAIARIYRWTLWKNHPSVVFSSKPKTKNKTKKHKQQDNENYKYQIIISNYDSKYPVTSKFTIF